MELNKVKEYIYILSFNIYNILDYDTRYAIEMFFASGCSSNFLK